MPLHRFYLVVASALFPSFAQSDILTCGGMPEGLGDVHTAPIWTEHQYGTAQAALDAAHGMIQEMLQGAADSKGVVCEKDTCQANAGEPNFTCSREIHLIGDAVSSYVDYSTELQTWAAAVEVKGSSALVYCLDCPPYGSEGPIQSPD